MPSLSPISFWCSNSQFAANPPERQNSCSSTETNSLVILCRWANGRDLGFFYEVERFRVTVEDYTYLLSPSGSWMTKGVRVWPRVAGVCFCCDASASWFDGAVGFLLSCWQKSTDVVTEHSFSWCSGLEWLINIFGFGGSFVRREDVVDGAIIGVSTSSVFSKVWQSC